MSDHVTDAELAHLRSPTTQSGYRGVYAHAAGRGRKLVRYRAQPYRDAAGRPVRAGHHATPVEAAKAVVRFLRAAHGADWPAALAGRRGAVTWEPGGWVAGKDGVFGRRAGRWRAVTLPPGEVGYPVAGIIYLTPADAERGRAEWRRANAGLWGLSLVAAAG